MFLENLHSWVSLKLGASLCSRGCESAEDAGRDMVFLVQRWNNKYKVWYFDRCTSLSPDQKKKKKKAYPTRSGLSLWHIFNPVYMVACPRAACLFTIFLDCFHWLQSFTEGKEILRGFTSACGAAAVEISLPHLQSDTGLWEAHHATIHRFEHCVCAACMWVTSSWYL